MSPLIDNAIFQVDYEKLREVSLNPARHVAANAHAHCEMVHERAVALGNLNGCTDEEIALLGDLAHAHDIGKITGTARPDESVALLPKYGITDEQFTNLVKYHDTNLPWYQAAQRGQPPSDKAWNRIARKLDVRILCLFMVADRVDGPGGWRANTPLVWFLDEVKRRNLLERDLLLDDGPEMPTRSDADVEECAGATLVRIALNEPQVLLIRVRQTGFEVPKGHIEPGETAEQAAIRELREETGLLSTVVAGEQVGALEYTFDNAGVLVHKKVSFFIALPDPRWVCEFGDKPPRTKELRWLTQEDLQTVPLVNEDLRPVIEKVFLFLNGQVTA